MELTPEEIMHRLRFSLTEACDKEAIIAVIREYGEQQRQQGMVDGFKNVSDWAAYNIDGLKGNNENLIV